MNLDVDFLIDFFEKNSNGSEKTEIGEQDAAGGGGGTTSAKPVPKWADVIGGPTRGVANSLPKKGQYWRDLLGGPKRGVANQLY
jgi:hypothetical protein